MPRRVISSQTETQSQTRVTRGSVSTDVASLPVSRRALGDVSNRRAAKAAESKKPSNAPLRRSRRLSKDTTTTTAGETITISNDTTANNRKYESGNTALSHLKSEPSISRSAQPEEQNALDGCNAAEINDVTRVGKSTKRSRADAIEDAPAKKKQKRPQNRSTQHEEIYTSDPSMDVIFFNACPDILDDGNHSLRREPFDDSKFTAGIASYDEEFKDDIRQVTGYATDIYQRLYHVETQTRPSPYMDQQPELNSMMRSILIDWIVEVHLKFRLIPETLYLAINIIDRYLQRERVQRKRLQLVGVTALLLACKYEEIYPPEVKDCVYITDRAYTRQDVLDMEAHIVKTLKFRMTVPTGYPFLRRFLHICKATRASKCLANFYMERMLQEYSALKYRPSLVAAAAVALAMNNPDALETEGYTLREAPGVPIALLEYSGFHIDEIREVAALMEEKVGEVDTTYSRRSLNSVKKKYAADKFDNVSSYILPAVRHLGVL